MSNRNNKNKESGRLLGRRRVPSEVDSFLTQDETQIMSKCEKLERELSVLNEEVGRALTEEFYDKCVELIDDLGMFELDHDGPEPLEVWAGTAQALADASGCRVILQSHIIDADKEGPDSEKIVGYREVAVGDPLLYLRK